MRRPTSLLVFALLLCSFLTFSAATQMDSATYNQTKTAIAAGGDNISSTNYLATVTIGQLIGQADSATYNTTLGFQADDFNSVPFISSVILNATDHPENRSSANLTAWPQGVTDGDGDPVNISYTWLKNNRSWPAIPESIAWTDIEFMLPFENFSNRQ